MFARMGTRVRAGFILGLLVALASCSSLTVRRETETSGTFTASGVALTLLAADFPSGALEIARAKTTATNLPNLQVENVFVAPYLGPVDWLLDILGVRYARITGTWGFPGP